MKCCAEVRSSADEAKRKAVEVFIYHMREKVNRLSEGGRNKARQEIDRGAEMLLQEVPHVRQRAEEGFRRYFTSEYFRLWVWYAHDKKSIEGFELLYGGHDDEKEITWMKKGVFSHHRVSGELSIWGGGAKMMQMLEGDAGKVRASTIYLFRRYASKIDREIVELVVSRIMEKTGITLSMMREIEREYSRKKASG